MERTTTHDSHYASSLIEASLDPLFTISLEGKITDMNQATINVTVVQERNLQEQIFSIILRIHRRPAKFIRKFLKRAL